MRISLFGYGRTTRAIARRLGVCTFYDDRVVVPHRDNEGHFLLPPSLFDPDRSDMEIPSPGIPPSHPLIAKARHLISEYDLFLGDRASPLFLSSSRPYTIWISGTNGKTTTTRMITHLLAHRGAVSGGNIGTPLADMETTKPIWVLETSSFTLHYTRYARPDLYLLLPVTPDHLSWHGGEAAYLAAKLKPLAAMKEGQGILLPQSLADTPSEGFKIGYDSYERIAHYFGIDCGRIPFEGIFALDAVLALGVTKILFDEVDYDRLATFRLDPHRQERFYDAKGRLWIDDSKATNLDATIQALAPHRDKKIHLILGGDDKGVDLTPLFDALKGYDVILYAIGANSERLSELARRYDLPLHRCHTLDQAVERIDALHDAHSVALLSPAAASLDQFASYAERGDRFKEFVSEL